MRSGDSLLVARCFARTPLTYTTPSKTSARSPNSHRGVRRLRQGPPRLLAQCRVSRPEVDGRDASETRQRCQLERSAQSKKPLVVVERCQREWDGGQMTD